MNAVDIVRDYLVKNGFDGLCDPDNECGCGLDDLISCESDFSGCEPAYKCKCDHKCPGGDNEYSDCFCTDKDSKCWMKELEEE